MTVSRSPGAIEWFPLVRTRRGEMARVCERMCTRARCSAACARAGARDFEIFALAAKARAKWPQTRGFGWIKLKSSEHVRYGAGSVAYPFGRFANTQRRGDSPCPRCIFVRGYLTTYNLQENPGA